jgi:hypothetical protein
MAFGGFDNDRQGAPMADINVTPMVDVMLVLLVISSSPRLCSRMRSSWTCQPRSRRLRLKNRKR